MEKFNQVLNYNKTISEDDFKRQVLIDLASDDDTPEDILSIRLGKVSETSREYMFVDAKVEVDYTLSVGYDNKVKEFNKYKNEYEYKTVTEWQPFAGKNSSSESEIIKNDLIDDYASYDRYVTDATSTAKKDAVEVLDADGMTINNDMLNVVKKSMIDSCFKKAKLPGDKQKDVKHNGVVTVTNLTGVRLGQYSMEYVYGDKKYPISSYTCGKPKTFGYPTPSVGKETAKAASKKVLPFTIIGLLLLIGGLGLAVLYEMLSISMAIGVIPAILGIIVLIIGSSKKKTLIKQANYLRKQAKLTKLKALLSVKKLAPLTLDETRLFSK